MEAKSPSEAQCLSADKITALPQIITEIILYLLPLKEAARTSILSKDWRYKWTTIPKLVFDTEIAFQGKSERGLSEMKRARKNMDQRCKDFYVVYQVLLLHQGPIHEFTLHMRADCDCFEVDQIILYLSRKHALKKLSLGFSERGFYSLPLCTFSFHQLTDLDLSCMAIDHQPIFGGFPNLRSLDLYFVYISTKALLHLLSNCQSLTKLTVMDLSVIQKIAPLLSYLSVFPLLNIWKRMHTVSGNVCILFRRVACSRLNSERAPALTNSPQVRMFKTSVVIDDDLRFLAALIKCSPNLETLAVHLPDDEISCDNLIWSGILEEYSNVRLEHLNELVIEFDVEFEPEMDFVKFILARSPKLKKVSISCPGKTDEEKFEILNALSQAPVASSVQIDLVYWDGAGSGNKTMKTFLSPKK